MRSCFLVLALASVSSTLSFAAHFAPYPMHISVPSYLRYDFEDKPLSIPFTLSGCPARVTLFIFKKGRPSAPVRNGYLGWHAVSGIDTCVYMSAPRDFPKGANVFEWSGKNDDGRYSAMEDHTFYLWGYDASSPGVVATNFIAPERFAAADIVTHDEDGRPMANSVLFDALHAPSSPVETARVIRNKWVIGNDPYDITLMETTAYTTLGEVPRLAMDGREWNRFFYTESVKADSVTLWKRKWVPNGDAEVVGNWGNLGKVAYPSDSYPHQPPFGGPVSDGADKLYFPYLFPLERGSVPNEFPGIACVSAIDGALLKNINLINSWSSPPDAVYCPGILEYRDGMLFTASPSACLAQMVDPTAEEPDYLVRWENGYGDGVWDKTLRPESFQHTWACFWSDVPPNPTSISPDANMFSLFPATGLDGASFGLFAPDGTGAGYFAISGMEHGTVRALHVVDYGSAFDGIYFAGMEAGGDSAGVRYVASDCVKGTIFGNGHWDGPHTRVVGLWHEEILRAGTVWDIMWESDGVKKVRIELTIDGWATWSVVADSVDAATGMYKWVVPDVSSTKCFLRVVDASGAEIGWTPSGRFIISGTSQADDADAPRPFVTVANRPNPFNPSTVIRYELGMPGRANLAVYTVTGQLVRRIDLGMKSRGTHEFLFDGSGLPSGVYLYRIDVGHASAAGKMLLVR